MNTIFHAGTEILVREPDHYLAFLLSQESREQLLEFRRPRYNNVITDHITIAYDFPVKDLPAIDDVLRNTERIEVVGLLLGDGIDCFNVALNGICSRPDGRFYHLTHSRNDQRESVESNKLFSGELKPIAQVPTYLPIMGKFVSLRKRTPIIPHP